MYKPKAPEMKTEDIIKRTMQRPTGSNLILPPLLNYLPSPYLPLHILKSSLPFSPALSITHKPDLIPPLQHASCADTKFGDGFGLLGLCLRETVQCRL